MTAKNKTPRWPLAEAMPIAERIAQRLTPACDRIQIAGSIRRLKADVGDVELLVIPRYTTCTTDLFGDAPVRDCLVALLKTLMDAQVFALASPRCFGPLNKRIIDCATGMKVDVFTTSARFWGMALFVRTGPAEHNVKVMRQLRHLGLRGHAYGGITDAQGVEHDCPDEETVYAFLQWPYTPPEIRLG